jgi:hypothetical protein
MCEKTQTSIEQERTGWRELRDLQPAAGDERRWERSAFGFGVRSTVLTDLVAEFLTALSICSRRATSALTGKLTYQQTCAGDSPCAGVRQARATY